MSSCAIITGGTTGIGKSIALRLAAEGNNIVLTHVGDLSEDNKVLALQGFEQYDGQVILIKGNVTSVEDCDYVVQETLKNFDDINILVNNAGITKDMLLMKMTKEDFTNVIDVNLVGSFNMIKAVNRKMIKQKYGRIVNISSVIGLTGNIGQVNYAASKAGLIGMSKSVARELATRNITVNCVAPGFIATKMTDVLEESVIDNIKAQIPTKKMGTPEDVANAVNFLCKEESSYITGQVLNVCGGMVM